MAERDPNRRFDHTQLREGIAKTGVLHRDYIAHCMRWSWSLRQMKRGMHVLDVGCGQDLPLLMAGTRSGANRPGYYVGVDINPVRRGHNMKNVSIFDKTSFVEAATVKKIKKVCPDGFDMAVNFEVIEHMEVADGRKLLKNVHSLLKPDGTFYLSTPVFNAKVGAAENHIHEYEFAELEAELEKAGFDIIDTIGTFIRYNAFKKVCTPEERAIYDELLEYHGHETLSAIFAMNYPEVANNCLWVLKKKKGSR